MEKLSTLLGIPISGIVFFGIVLLLMFLSSGGSDNSPTKELEKNPKYIKERDKLIKQAKREKLSLEAMEIKIEEIKQKIESLKYQITTDLDKEQENALEIRKQELALKQAEIKFNEKGEKYTLLIMEIGGLGEKY